MSRVGRKPIFIPERVEIKIEKNKIRVKGPKGELERKIPPGYEVVLQDRQILVKKLREDKQSKALHGTLRSLIFNMVKGTSESFEKVLEIMGVGYKAKLEGRTLSLNLGFSHTVKYNFPEGVKVELPNPTTIRVSGCDKQKVGEVSAEIRRLKKPEPYKGKGVRYRGEVVKRKVGKRALGGAKEGA
ncbi:MAG: 50S ribosomal protein L6 [Candidatus Aerophobetes bacterium]|nr:50S ribosomal protein L6 [Candidatus Aerophobetes bacterium]